MEDIPTYEWSKHAFDPRTKSPHITNNVCEFFNEWVDKLRDKPILTLVNGIRRKIMGSFHRKYQQGCTWSKKVGPRIMDELNTTLKDGRLCKVFAAGRNQFEVQDGFTRFVVNLEERHCGCNAWAISGLPCKHAAACIVHNHGKIEDYCDRFYNSSLYLESYSYIITPLLDPNMLEDIEVLPPPLSRMPGRLRKRRRREQDEGPTSTKAKRSATVKCSNCQELGHNMKGYQRAPVQSRKKKG